MDNYDLVPDGDEWKLKKEGAKRATKTFDTKTEGLSESIDYMKDHGGSLKIHKGDGSIQEERTYPKSKIHQNQKDRANFSF